MKWTMAMSYEDYSIVTAFRGPDIRSMQQLNQSKQSSNSNEASNLNRYQKIGNSFCSHQVDL